MNKRDIAILRANWELKKEQLANCEHGETMDISSSCYVKFGACVVSIYKYRNGFWQRKTVNCWKSLSFNGFVENLDLKEWESI